MDILLKIKRLVLAGSVRFTLKAYQELESDGLNAGDAVESILNAQSISKTLRSRSALRSARQEKLYVLRSFNFSGTLIYTKGKVAREPEGEVFYVLISAKIDTLNE